MVPVAAGGIWWCNYSLYSLQGSIKTKSLICSVWFILVLFWKVERVQFSWEKNIGHADSRFFFPFCCLSLNIVHLSHLCNNSFISCDLPWCDHTLPACVFSSSYYSLWEDINIEWTLINNNKFQSIYNNEYCLFLLYNKTSTMRCNM